MDTALLRAELIGEAVAHALDEERGGLNHFETNMARGNEVNDEILVDGALLGLTEEYTGLGDVAVASALALRATRDAGGRLTCFSARVDLRQCADGVCDRHDFGAPRGLGGMSFSIRRCGEVLCDNARGHLGNALYAHCIRIENAADHDEMIRRTVRALNRHTLSNLRAQATAAGIRDNEPRFAIYVGRVEDGPDSGAWPRNLKHEDGTSGATRFCSFIGELVLRPFYTRARRLLAIGANTRTGCKLEASGAQYCGVGRGHPFNDAHAGEWRYALGDGHRDDLFVFLPLLCEVDGWGDRPLREALDDAARWRADFPSGVEAADRLADLPFAIEAFGSRDGLLAATPREILSALGSRLWAKVAALKARLADDVDVDGLKYCAPMTPAGESYWAWVMAQARVKQREQLGSAPPLDVQRAAVLAIHAAALETTGYNDAASAAACAASSNAADFEALRQRDADLVNRTRAIPHFSKFIAQRTALKARFAAAGYPDLGWATNATPEDTSFFRFQLAKARQAARKRFGDDASALLVAFTEIRTIFREAADFEDDAYVDACDAAALDALAAADADVVDSARQRRRQPKPKPPPAPKFPQKLADMVKRHVDVVSWDATARELVVFDQARFESEVMPRYFRTNKFDSFHRQLNYHGFSIAKSAADASRPEGALVYSNNTADADLTKLVSSHQRAKPTPVPAPAPKPKPRGRAARAARRAGLAPAAPAFQSPVAAAPYKSRVRLSRAVLDQVADIRRAREAEAAAGPAVADAAAGASPKRPRPSSPVEEKVDGAEPKRARRELVAADPLASSAVCIALVGGAGAMAFWPKIVEAGLDDAQKLVGADADAALAGFGLSPAQRSIIRDGLAAVGFQ